MSALGQKRTSATLFDRLIGLREQRRRDCYAECLSGLEINHQLVLGRLLHGQVGRLSAFENTIDVRCAPVEQVDGIDATAALVPAGRSFACPLLHLRPTSFSIAASWCGSTPSAFITALMIESDRMSSSVGSDWQQFTIIRFLAGRNDGGLSWMQWLIA